MKKIFRLMIKESSNMQDLRGDKAHAETITNFASKLCSELKLNKEIVIPAAILHDIGYYKMDKNLLADLMAGKLSPEQSKLIKEEHMQKGAILAKEILEKVKYPPELIREIIRIISQHDSDNIPLTKEEEIVRDADKLWRFSEKGFNLDVKRRNCPRKEWYSYLMKNIDKPGYFYTQAAKNIALKELNIRKKFKI